MKHKLILLYLLLIPSVLMSQEKLNSLLTPSSPASSILGLQPKTVLTPKSYQALEAALYSNFLNENAPVVANDFSLEFTPYWTKDHGLSINEYLYPKSIVDQINRNSSFSIASTQNYLLGDSSKTNCIALGYRTTFYFGNRSDRKKIESYDKKDLKNKRIYNLVTISAEKVMDSDLVKCKDDFKNEIKVKLLDILLSNPDETNAQILTKKIISCIDTIKIDYEKDSERFTETFNDVVDSVLKGEEQFNEFKSYIKKRDGLTVDLAAAALVNFPTNNFEYSFAPNYSIWVTPTYQLSNHLCSVKLMLVFRYEWYDLYFYRKYFPENNILQNNKDLGVAIATEFQKFSLQFELVGRYSDSEIPAGTDTEGNPLFRKDTKSDTQYVGTFSYNLSDQLVLSYSFGNRFDPIQNPKGTLISTLSLNFGFGAPGRDAIK